ncbi:MAG: alpha/beta hydrolase [Pseudomonadota bacterium]|nr:alpha/beta hydrolase [Pseudomonadota bacterium]
MPIPESSTARRLPRFLLRRTLLAGSALLALTGCSGATLLNAVVSSGGYRLDRGRAYGPDPQQLLDVYVPRAAGAGTRTTVVFVHGGRWESGDRGMYKFAAEALASRGWVAVIPDYRKYPAVRWPVFVEDCADATQWAALHAAEWGGDRSKVVLMGHSAGAHIAALLALDPRYASRMPALPRPAGVVGLAGPYDFLPLTDADLQDMFATAADLRDTQPIHHVHAGTAPMLLLHGEADDTVKPRNTHRLAAALRAVGVPVQEQIYADVDHLRLVAALAWPFRSRYPVLDDIGHFIAGLA